MQEQITLETGTRPMTVDLDGENASAPERSTLPSVWRLMAFVLITATYLARAILSRVIIRKKEKGPGAGPFIIHRWARRLNRALGLEVTVIGEPPAETALLASNHRSYMDITAIGSCLPTTFLAKSEVARWPLIGPGCRLVDVVFVERESAASRWKAREEIALRLRSGMSIVVFPEGTSFEGPGLLSFRPGIFSLASAAGFPVVPVAVSYEKTSDAWVDKDTFLRHFLQTFSRPRVRVTVSFGPVMRNNDPDRLRRSTWRWIDSALKNSFAV
jgi:lyso-ornithine lipid O-acyltransferase